MIRLFDVQRFSFQDGTGIRTCVFLKGCPLRCRWCHNPEGLGRDDQLLFYAEKCVGCGLCIAACQRGAHSISGGVHSVNRSKCVVCGACAEACATHALTVAGYGLDAEALYRKIARDKPFYNPGGVTFTGGEPLFQAEALLPVLWLCRKNGIHIAVETSLYAPWTSVEQVSGFADLLLCDLKSADADRLAAYTSAKPDVIYENLRKLLGMRGNTVWVRIPVIPGFNDGEDDFVKIGRFLSPYAPARVELLPFHGLASTKYTAVGKVYAYNDIQEPSRVRMDELRGILASFGVEAI